MRRALLMVLAVALLTGCEGVTPDAAPPEQLTFYLEPPRGVKPDACWGKDDTLPVFETALATVIVAPEVRGPDGTLVSEAIYGKRPLRRMAQKPLELWFETPCQDKYTPDIVSSLQRALQVRGLYQGAVDGRMTAETREAVRAYQKPRGLDSGVLSLEAALQLGLVAFGRDGV